MKNTKNNHNKNQYITSFSIFLLALVFFTASLGCTGPSFKNWRFKKGGLEYNIGGLDSHWREIKVSENDIAFYSKRLSAIIQVNSTCREDYEDVALLTLRQNLLIGLTDRKFLKEEKRKLSRREALYSVLKAKLDGVDFKVAMIQMKKNACIYDFIYYVRPWNFGRGIGDFWRVVYGFKVTSR